VPADPRFTLQTAASGPDVLVVIRGELDVTVAPDLAQALARLRGTVGGDLVLNMSEVEFIDCACAQVIAQAAAAWPAPAQAVIRDPSPIVRRVFQLSDLAAVVRMDAAPAQGAVTGPPRRAEANSPLPSDAASPGCCG
jgi:anti-anti-sigma factor